jgi:hypothetical protein
LFLDEIPHSSLQIEGEMILQKRFPPLKRKIMHYRIHQRHCGIALDATVPMQYGEEVPLVFDMLQYEWEYQFYGQLCRVPDRHHSEHNQRIESDQNESHQIENVLENPSKLKST